MITSNFDTKALIKTLQTLPKNIQNNVVVGGIRAGANVVRDEAKQRVAKDTHNLKKSITTFKMKAKKGEITFAVSPAKYKSLPDVPYSILKKQGKAGGWYAHFLEFGTSKMNAKPFLRSALESKQTEVLDAAKDYIGNRLPNEVTKARR